MSLRTRFRCKKNSKIILLTILGQLFAAHYAFSSSFSIDHTMATALEDYGGSGLEIDSVTVSSLVKKSFEGCGSINIQIMDPVNDFRRPRYRVSCEENGYSRLVSGRATGKFTGLISEVNIDRGMTVLGSDVSEKVLDLSEFRPGALRKKNNVFGRVVKSRISSGALIRDSHLQPRYDILSGQMINVSFYSGSIEYNDEAVAKQSGRVGDKILVMNKNSKKIYSAVITGIGEVDVGLR